jgi:hypothetical protein
MSITVPFIGCKVKENMLRTRTQQQYQFVEFKIPAKRNPFNFDYYLLELFPSMEKALNYSPK